MNDASTWKALSDPTRRKMLDLLRERPLTTGDICAHFPKMTRIAAMKHLKVLEAAQLLFVRREGKFRWNYLNPVPIQKIYERWVRPYEAVWANLGLQLKHHVESQKEKRRDRNRPSSRH
jgi:DNA-binding transcriptional ArsR family regulator